MLALRSEFDRDVYFWEINAYLVSLFPLEEVFILKFLRQLFHICDWNRALPCPLNANIGTTFVSHSSVPKNRDLIIGTLSEAAYAC